jgi:hypothetical protein
MIDREDAGRAMLVWNKAAKLMAELKQRSVLPDVAGHLFRWRFFVVLVDRTLVL